MATPFPPLLDLFFFFFFALMFYTHDHLGVSLELEWICRAPSPALRFRLKERSALVMVRSTW
jgi:hypothetical protein